MSLLDRALDASIYFSFDRSGYLRHARAFDPADLRVELEGRTCLVTGANSGIGLATCHALAARKATVVMLCRDLARGRSAREAVARASGNAQVRVEQLDVADLTSVRAFVARFDAPHVDVLVHNAGVLLDRREETADGIERTFATGVVGPFALTALLRPRFARTAVLPGARVVWVASGGMYGKALRLPDPGDAGRPFDGVAAYAETKRAQVVLSELWAARLGPEGVLVDAMHPGWADTPSVRTALPRFHSFTAGRLRTPEQGADTVVWLAIAARRPEDTGKFWFDRRPRATNLIPGTGERPGDRAALWAACERLSGVAVA